MNVAELIQVLAHFNPGSEVGVVWDGADRTCPEFAWLTADGRVLLAGTNDTVYSDSDRPVMGPRCSEKLYWDTPKYIEGMCRIL